MEVKWFVGWIRLIKLCLTVNVKFVEVHYYSNKTTQMVYTCYIIDAMQ